MARSLLGPPDMLRLALLGIAAAFVAGCPTTHAIVRSCDEATAAPEGTACEGFTDCAACGRTIRCTAGALVNHVSFDTCDAGVGADASHPDASHDVDAGPCAPHPPLTGVGCHVTSDCDATRFEVCYSPGTGPGCPLCVRAMHLCTSDADCASTDFCESYVDPCSHPGFCGNGSDVTSTRCVPRCTATSCGAGQACDPSGRCTPISCVGGGYTCPAHTTCHDLAGGDAHGCVRDTCSVDSDCGCGGACLSGSCYDTLGTCMPPAA